MTLVVINHSPFKNDVSSSDLHRRGEKIRGRLVVRVFVDCQYALVSCQPSGVLNFEVDPRVLKILCNSSITHRMVM